MQVSLTLNHIWLYPQPCLTPWLFHSGIFNHKKKHFTLLTPWLLAPWLLTHGEIFNAKKSHKKGMLELGVGQYFKDIQLFPLNKPPTSTPEPCKLVPCLFVCLFCSSTFQAKWLYEYPKSGGWTAPSPISLQKHGVQERPARLNAGVIELFG